MEIISNGIRIAEFSILPNETGPWHFHSQVEEYCFCLKRLLFIEIEGRASMVLNPGERVRIVSGVQHRVRNGSQRACQYLVVEGVGEYDFVQVETAPPG
jgi:quercetin dioxygenase-like cupin family protein